MHHVAASSASQNPVTGLNRVLRGFLAASVAVGSAAISHSAAGHHMPDWTVLVLAFLVSLPVCVWLASVQLSRIRLGAGVLFSQAMLHGLFTLFPVVASSPSARVHGGASDYTLRSGHAAHDHALSILAAIQNGAVTHPSPDGPMILAHLLAAAATFAAIRRGELILHALGTLVLLCPVFILFLRPVSLTGPRAICAHDSFSSVILRDLWLGGGAQTLRGPPVLVN